MDIDTLAKLFGIAELPKYIHQVDETLHDVIGSHSARLRDPALRVLQGGGKRLRPLLVFAAATSGGTPVDDTIIAAASAIELVHLATIVHDDIIDRAQERHGEKTIQAQEGIDTAILVGDYLLALALVQAATVSKEIARVVAATIATLCDGQQLEIRDEYNASRSLDDYLETIHGKTASLIAAACRVGALCAKLPTAQVEAFSRYGEAFGMSFQLIDDVLDFVATPESIGKPVGNDLQEGVYTMPLLLSLQGPDQDTVRSWLTPRPTVDRSTVIRTLKKNGSLDSTLQEAQRYNAIAAHELKSKRNPLVVDGLKQLPDRYKTWILKKVSYHSV